MFTSRTGVNFIFYNYATTVLIAVNIWCIIKTRIPQGGLS